MPIKVNQGFQDRKLFSYFLIFLIGVFSIKKPKLKWSYFIFLAHFSLLLVVVSGVVGIAP